MSSMSPPTVLDQYTQGWWLTWRHWKISLVPMLGLTWFNLGASKALNAFLPPESYLASICIFLYSFAMTFAITAGVYNMSLKAYDGQSVGFRDFGNGAKRWWPLVVSHVIFYALVALGGVLLIVPGLWLACRFALFHLFIFDRGVGAIASLKAAWRLSHGRTWLTAGLTIPIVVYTVLSLCFPPPLTVRFVLAPFETLYFTMLAFAQIHLYRRCQAAQADAVSAA